MADRQRDWASVLDDALAAKEPRPTRRSVAVNYPPELYRHIQAASRARGMSMSAFQRRAALAIALFDLGLDWTEAMAAEPPVGPFDGSGKPTPAAGAGYGPWRIEGLS